MYNLLSEVNTSLVKYTDAYSNLAIDAVNQLISTLLNNGTINEKQVQGIVEAINKSYTSNGD